MDFIVNEELVEINVKGEVFKYKPATTGDELEWIKDYSSYVEKEIEGKKVTVYEADEGKLSLCKLRNIMEVPFTREELNKICGINKEFKDFNGSEKDLLFKRFDGLIFNALIKGIDATKKAKKE